MSMMYKIRSRIKRDWNLIPYYGFRNTIQMDSLLEKIKVVTDSFEKQKLLDKRHQMVLDYIQNNLNKFRNTPFMSCRPVRTDFNDKNIWVFWAQGENSMPPLVKACYNSLIKNANGHKVILVNMENLSKYLTFTPPCLTELAKVSLIHFFLIISVSIFLRIMMDCI